MIGRRNVFFHDSHRSSQLSPSTRCIFRHSSLLPCNCGGQPIPSKLPANNSLFCLPVVVRVRCALGMGWGRKPEETPLKLGPLHTRTARTSSLHFAAFSTHRRSRSLRSFESSTETQSSAGTGLWESTTLVIRRENFGSARFTFCNTRLAF